MPGTSYFNRRLTSLRFEVEDGTGITVDGKEGDIQLGATNAENYEVNAVYDNDQFDGFTPGQDSVQDLSVTIRERNQALTDDINGTVQDWVHHRGEFESLQSIDDSCWCFIVIASYDDGNGGVATRTYPYVRSKYTPAIGQPANTGVIEMQNFRAPVDT